MFCPRFLFSNLDIYRLYTAYNRITSCLVARVKFTQFTATILSFIPILPSIAAAPFGLIVLTKIPPKSGPPCQEKICYKNKSQ